MSRGWTIEREGPLAVVTLDAGPLNLFDDAVFEGLEETVVTLESDPPRGVLFRAEGRVVSGGVDVKVFDAISSAHEAGKLWERLIDCAQRVEDLPCPTIFAAHALCLTAAFELSLACDLIVAAESARFGLVERVVGLTPAMGGTQRLAERAGPARARELVYTGGLFDARTLEAWNVVNRIWPDEEFEAAARAFAQHVAEGPTIAHRATKTLVRAACDDGVRAADALVPEVAGALFETEDLKGAVASFLAEGPGKATYSGT
jgi:enoyl-CoA hydratase/carnithine racemase